jgi:glutathione S-transferase
MAAKESVKANTGSQTLILYGFPRSTYVNVARLVLLAKQLTFAFHNTEDEMYTDVHVQRHPFGRVPVLRHGDFILYETSAIAQYIDECFDGPPLQPIDSKRRALGWQWISSLSAYYYPYMIYYLVHERVVFADLDIPADEAVVAYALPKIELALRTLDTTLGQSRFIVDERATLADYFLLPSVIALGFAPEGQDLLEKFPAVRAWLQAMGQLPEVMAMRAQLPPRAPIKHARQWVEHHRPSVR